MSQIQTAPELNPTVIEVHPNQIMEVQQLGQDMYFGTDSESAIRNLKTLTGTQMDFEKFAMKDKILDFRTWSVGSTADWMGIEFDIPFIRSLTTRVNENFVYFNPVGLILTMNNANNAFCQGMTWVCHDPSPTLTYYQDIYDLTWDLGSASQLQRVEITPLDAEQVRMHIPILLNFNFFRTEVTATEIPALYAKQQQTYLDGISLGRLRTFVPASLETKNARTSLFFPLSARLSAIGQRGTKIR